jgi:hypothetical protein
MKNNYARRRFEKGMLRSRAMAGITATARRELQSRPTD